MSSAPRLTLDERSELEALIRAFDNHGCSQGLDVRAQAALRRLLAALDEAETAIKAMTLELNGLRRQGPAR